MPLKRAHTKSSRRLGLYLRGSVKAFQRRPYKPGVHGTSQKRRTNESDYAIQLKEKQKVRILYGLQEAQLRRFFATASKTSHATGEALLGLLERRLDNIVYRAGFARTRAQARQMVVHGHVQLDGKKATAPSHVLGMGERVSIVGPDFPSEDAAPPEWLATNRTKKEVSVKALPTREQMPMEINEQLIVEYYSR